MNALLAVLALIFSAVIALFMPGGAAALAVCAGVAAVAGVAVYSIKVERTLLLQLFVSGLLIRMLIGSLIFGFNLQEFFGGDALTYDFYGFALLGSWQGETNYAAALDEWFNTGGTGWGMTYVVAGIYAIVGRNMLAVQFFNAVLGAATAPLIFLCAQHIFGNLRVSRIAAYFVALFPSLVLWSSQGLKDGPIVFLLAVAMLTTLKLGEQLTMKRVLVLMSALAAILTMRFYIFYMVATAIGGAFIIGMRPLTANSAVRQFVVIIVVGVMVTYLGVLRGRQLETYGNLRAVQVSRNDLATSASSGFGRDVDVSTTSGALTVIPIGMIYLLFAPFPWQLANLRQSITLPEMLVWWCSFPLLVLGVWFTIKYRLRQALPIMIFTTMLTIGYSIFQGNVGTAYRQRSQILVFYFIFVAVGFVLLREKQEDRHQHRTAAKQQAAYVPVVHAARMQEAQRRYEVWKNEKEKELEDIARSLSERIDF